MPSLFSPGAIGGVEIRNRIVYPSITTRLADDEGFATDAGLAYYWARARGGAGLITVEMASPEKVGRHRRRELGIYDDRFLPGLRALVDVIHDEGAAVSIQLGHGGGHTREDICGEAPIAPSAIPHSVFEVTSETIVPLEMTRGRIRRTVAAFAAAAKRAQAAGFDCVEIHASHGYLISQFLCPEENQRDDEYGGSLKNRARFGLEILEAVRAEAPGIAVIFRLSVEDFFPNGLRFDEGRQVAIWAAEAGADALHITAGHYRSRPPHMMIPPMVEPEAPFLRYAAAVKAVVDIPVIAVARLGDPAIAAGAVESGAVDFVALGRTLVADPEWPNEVRQGGAVRRCIACNTCVNEMRGGAQIGCLVNPVAGHELDWSSEPAISGERIAVIGAGPAGLSFASLVADANEVTVFERASVPGGALRLAGKAPRFQDVEARTGPLLAYIDGLELMSRQKGAVFRYNTDVASDPGLLAPFDRIVIATGARYRYGLGLPARAMLATGLGRIGPMRSMFEDPGWRDWFYYEAREATGPDLARLFAPGKQITIIGDALKAGKAREAIASAFDAALGRRESLQDLRYGT